ncbi:MAG: molybdopterin-binding protein, partial [Pseudomonadota bacterium]
MRFGAFALQDAAGAILAHSVSLPGGRLRKGIRLEAPHIARLQDAGHIEVVAALLEPGDIHEDAAATALGDALLQTATGIRASTAATGRVNLIARTPGVAILDAAKIAMLNSVDPMISLATVPPCHQIHAGGMLATVKIISYAVSETDLNAALKHAVGAITLAQPTGLSAELIVTQINEGADESKGIAATAARVEALGSKLSRTTLVPHSTKALMKALEDSTADLVLILTGSATSDAHDVGPSALQSAGGKLTRFGMPVDPGNLLFLGQLQGRSVLGLPGCARAPALNGADMVLSRLMCGLAVSSQDIANMG